MERPPAKLLDKVRYRIRVKGYSIRNKPDCCPRR